MPPSLSHRELIAALFVLVTIYVPRAKKSALLLMLLLLTVVLGLVMPSFTSTAIPGAEQQAFPDNDSLAAPYDTTGLAHQDHFVAAEAHRYAGPLLMSFLTSVCSSPDVPGILRRRTTLSPHGAILTRGRGAFEAVATTVVLKSNTTRPSA